MTEATIEPDLPANWRQVMDERECPQCGAQPGMPCWGGEYMGRSRTVPPHAARYPND